MKSVVDEFYEKHSYKDGKINDNCENDPYGEMKARLILLAEKFERFKLFFIFATLMLS